MKNYNLSNYNTYEDLKKELVADLKAELNDTIITEHALLGHGEGHNISAGGEANICVDMTYPSRTAATAINYVLDASNVSVANDVIIREYCNALAEAYKVETKRAADERAAQLEAEKQAKEAKKRAEKLEKMKENELRRVNNLKPVNFTKSYDEEESFYYDLGWMAGHCTSVSMAMPDYLEPIMKARYGDVPMRVVDQNDLTSGGFSKQWALSMMINFKTKYAVPAGVKKLMTAHKHAITTLEAVSTLVDEYNFTFGKKQDIEAIKTCVPAEYIEAFEAGFSSEELA